MVLVLFYLCAVLCWSVVLPMYTSVAPIYASFSPIYSSLAPALSTVAPVYTSPHFYASYPMYTTAAPVHKSEPPPSKMGGYSTGYLSDCPGSNKKAIITKKSLKYLSITIQGDNFRRSTYNYFDMKGLSKDKDLDFKKKTILYVGGYLDHPVYPFATTVAVYYRKEGYNVLLLDANKFSTMEYPIAARYSRPVGFHTAEMLANLTQAGLDPKKTELIGLSLGGQTMSFIAKTYKTLTGKKLSRLTGLDPAGPCFRNMGPEDRLHHTDADFVDVINTNIDGYGMADPMGHVHFYANGGEFQPGDIFWIPCTVLCSHIRSFTLWIAAMENKDKFIGMQCDTVQQARERKCYDRRPMVTNILGLNTNKSIQGLFYLATTNNFPYYLGVDGLKKENDFFLRKLNILNQGSVMKM